MAYFNRDNNRGGDKGFRKRDFGGKGFGGGRRDFGNKPKPFMHQATCAECGSSCEVPFKPVPGRAVFCSNCFGARGGAPGSTKPARFDSPRPNFAEKRPFQENNGGFKQYKEQFDMLNSKLDAILKAISPKAEAEPEAAVSPKKEKKALAKVKSVKAPAKAKKKAKVKA